MGSEETIWAAAGVLRAWIQERGGDQRTNEGLRSKKRLWRKSGREQLEAFRLAPRGEPATGGSAEVAG